MNRREFTKSFGATVCAAAALRGRGLSRSENGAIDSEPPFPLSVMLWTVYRDLRFEKRLEKIREAGYHHVELVDEFRNWSAEDFARANRKKRELEISFDATSGVRHGIANPGDREAFLRDIESIAVVADKLECGSIIVLSGNRDAAMSHEKQHESCVEGLKRAAEVAERRNVALLVENIDPEENPRYFLTSVAEGLQIIGEVNHPRVKFLYDFYHEQIAEGNLIEKLEKDIQMIGVVHVADVPGRHEPGSGEINYVNIFKKLASLKFRGYVAMEFLPTNDPVVSLRGARQLAALGAAVARKAGAA